MWTTCNVHSQRQISITMILHSLVLGGCLVLGLVCKIIMFGIIYAQPYVQVQRYKGCDYSKGK